MGSASTETRHSPASYHTMVKDDGVSVALLVLPLLGGAGVATSSASMIARDEVLFALLGVLMLSGLLAVLLDTEMHCYSLH